MQDSEDLVSYQFLIPMLADSLGKDHAPKNRFCDNLNYLVNFEFLKTSEFKVITERFLVR